MGADISYYTRCYSSSSPADIIATMKKRKPQCSRINVATIAYTTPCVPISVPAIQIRIISQMNIANITTMLTIADTLLPFAVQYKGINANIFNKDTTVKPPSKAIINIHTHDKDINHAAP